MALQYKLEFLKDDEREADDAVYIQLRRNPPVYLDRIDKEDFDILDAGDKHIFAETLFNIAGVTELSLKAYRVWLMKSPVYSWQEVIDPILAYFLSYYGESELEALPGSGNVDGTGYRLEAVKDRRGV